MNFEISQSRRTLRSRSRQRRRLGRSLILLVTVAGMAITTTAPAVAAPNNPTPEFGLVGGGTVVTLDAPQAIEYEQVEAGVPFSVAVTSAGTAYAWGDNWFGQHGSGALGGSSREPVPVAMPDGVTVTQVSAGADHTLALGSDGNVYAWGDNVIGQLGLGDSGPFESAVPVQTGLPADVTVSAIAAGGYHSFALATDGRLFAWGNNSHGQLGLGTSGGSVHTPQLVHAPAGVTFTSVSVGHYHALAIAQDGTAYAWGRNNYGQLGLGDTTDHATPVAITGPLTTVSVTLLVAGQWYSMAIVEGGTAYAWGDNLFGQLGDGTKATSTLPAEIVPPAAGVQFTDLEASGSFSLGIGSDGLTYAWGDNYYGQLGNSAVGAEALTPVSVHIPAGAAPLELLSAAGDHAFARGADGIVYGWGFNDSGRLGIGPASTAPVPTPVLVPEGEVTDVQFDGVSATSIVDNGDGTLTVTTPAHEAGTVDVSVHWSIAGVAQSPIVYAEAFTYAFEPTISISPAAQQANDGEEAVLTAIADGFPAPELSWQVSTDAGATWMPITSGLTADGTVLTVQAELSVDGSLYRVIASNLVGSTVSDSAQLTVVEKSDTVLPPAVIEQPGETSLSETGASPHSVSLPATSAAALLLLGLVFFIVARRRQQAR